jgi:Tfp pilus assembly protein PilF
MATSRPYPWGATRFARDSALSSLLARDAVEQNLSDVIGQGGVAAAEHLVGLDARLQNLAPKLAVLHRAINGWRGSLTIPTEAWWWSLHEELPTEVTRTERIMTLLTIPLFFISTAFGIDLANRFGIDGGQLIATLYTTLLGSISIGSLFSADFRKRLALLLSATGVRRKNLRLTLLLLIVTGLLAVWGLWFWRPAISRYYNNKGTEALGGAERQKPQLAAARRYLERAVRLDPLNALAHYNLASVYEELFEEEKAAAEYQIAFAAGIDLAYNNLGRMWVLRGEYSKAASLLSKALNRQEQTAKPIEQDTHYNLLKNLGWARVGQGRFSEARHLLEEAGQIGPNHASAHCLLGRILVNEGDSAKAASQWRKCLAWADPTNPDEDVWIGEAQSFLHKISVGEQP